MLPSPVTLQHLEAVTWKAGEIGKGGGRIEYFQPLPTLPLKALERPHELAPCEQLGALVLEAQDHTRPTCMRRRCTSSVFVTVFPSCCCHLWHPKLPLVTAY